MAIPQSLTRLRFRLTAWYVVTFLVVLLLLGVGLFATITRYFDRDLDASLRDATASLATIVRTRGVEASANLVPLSGRYLLLFDTAGHALTQPEPQRWLGQLAARAATDGEAHTTYSPAPERILRAFARRFDTPKARYVAVAVANEIEVEDKYAALIAASGAAALAAIVLVGVGGSIVARQSTRPVEIAMEHMQRFVADAAHELRTPLTVVRTRAEVALQRTRGADEYRDALVGIEQEAERVGHIVEDLLTLARADAGVRRVDRHRIFLDDVVLDAVEAARPLAERKRVKLEVEEFEEAPVHGDRALLRQLSLILLDNAIKFCDERGSVRVAVRAIPAGAELIVADDGPGIPADQLPHVFDRFYRGNVARTRDAASASEGAGLGLSIAQWIADEHHASIRIRSDGGRGTRVAVEFPLALDAMSSS